jgi:hypothetical protein
MVQWKASPLPLTLASLPTLNPHLFYVPAPVVEPYLYLASAHLESLNG